MSRYSRLANRSLVLMSVCCVLGYPLSVLGAEQNEHLFGSMGIKQLTWWQMGESEAVEFDGGMHRVADFNLAAGDNFAFGASVNLDDEVDGYRELTVRAGFGSWGMTVQQGKINGEIQSTGGGADDWLDIATEPRSFEEDFQLYALYWATDWVSSHHGIGYAGWTVPTESAVYYEDTDPLGSFQEEVRFLDPEAEFEVVGYYSRYDPLEAVLTDAHQAGFEIGTNGIVGLGRAIPSEVHTKEIAAVTGLEPSSDPVYGIGVFGSFRLGYYFGNPLDEAPRGFAYGVGLGVEASHFGLVSFESTQFMLTTEQTEHQRLPDHKGQGSCGPFLRFAAMW